GLLGSTLSRPSAFELRGQDAHSTLLLLSATLDNLDRLQSHSASRGFSRAPESQSFIFQHIFY
ncbi:MAG TPA: hypothetical protein VGH65_01265, partial [Verrucomicrobiaceae bacterium]